MCGSRKYPYPTTGGISLSTPFPNQPPWIFHIYKELVTHPPPPPTPPLRNFHKVRQSPHQPLWKSLF